MVEMMDLPNGWTWVSLADIALINPKLPFEDIPDDLDVSFLPMKLVEEVSNVIHLTETRKYKDVKKGFVPMTDGDVIFAKITPCMENGKVAVVHSLANRIAFGSTEFHVFRCHDSVANHFLFFYLVQAQFRQNAQHNMTGAVGQRRVPKKYLEEHQLPLPPLAEQGRIVAKIEELFSSLDKGVENLQTAQAQLKTYRQAVLKWAFEGRLTNENVKDGELPAGWKWVKIHEAAESLDSHRRPINKEERVKRKGEIPYYGANGRTGWIDDYLFNEPLVLVVEDETFIGRKEPFSYKITGKSWVNNHAHILRPKGIIDLDYLNYQLMFYPFLQFTTGTTGRQKLTKNALMNAPIKICHLEEQARIVSEIEARLSVCDQLEESIAQSLVTAEALRQSILKKAFEGKLVPQDPADEPASALLARIRAQREKTPQDKLRATKGKKQS